jgi:hypothetical protein
MRACVLSLALMVMGPCFSCIPSASGGLATDSADQDSPEKPAKSSTGLRMTPGIVCRSIDGYENYEPLPGAAQTSEEKLLVYLRPLGFKTEMKDGQYQAHLVPDFEIHKRGEKRVLRRKAKAFEYKPKGPQPPRLIYLKNVVSLKELPPGEYDLIIILHDEIAGDPPATQVVPFRIIPPADPARKVEPGQPEGRAS